MARYKVATALALLCSTVPAGATRPAPTPHLSPYDASVLDKLAALSERICKAPKEIGYTVGVSAEVEAHGVMSKLLKKLADIGLSARANYTGERYEGIAQKDLGKAFSDRNTCAREVFVHLVDNFTLRDGKTATPIRRPVDPRQAFARSSARRRVELPPAGGGNPQSGTPAPGAVTVTGGSATADNNGVAISGANGPVTITQAPAPPSPPQPSEMATLRVEGFTFEPAGDHFDLRVQIKNVGKLPADSVSFMMMASRTGSFHPDDSVVQGWLEKISRYSLHPLRQGVEIEPADSSHTLPSMPITAEAVNQLRTGKTFIAVTVIIEYRDIALKEGEWRVMEFCGIQDSEGQISVVLKKNHIKHD